MRKTLLTTLLLLLTLSTADAQKMGVAIDRAPEVFHVEETEFGESSEGSVVYGSVVVTDLLLDTEIEEVEVPEEEPEEEKRTTILDVIRAILNSFSSK